MEVVFIVFLVLLGALITESCGGRASRRDRKEKK